jgi:hypothetical protein
MNVPLGEWTVLPAAAVLGVAFVCRLLRRRDNPTVALASRWAPLFVALLVFAGLWIFETRVEPLPVIFALLYGLVEPSRSITLFPPRGRRAAVPLLLGTISACLSLWVWSGGNFEPRYHDESAYLLQGGIFAEGRWSAPSPPLPEFFEQFHVLVVPTRAAKYPPGHALLLAPGVALRAPVLVPLVLVGATGAFLFVLTRRLAGDRSALLAWLIWTFAPGGLRYRSSYFSELTTSFLCLAVWWAVLRWRETDRPIWLSVAAFGVSWGAITRPLTMLVFGIPLGIAILHRLVKRRVVRDLAPVAVAALLPLLLLPLWSRRTTGSWSTTPLAAYTKAYLPFDVPGFGARSTSPERPLPDCMRGLPKTFLQIHREHQVAALTQILRERVAAVLLDAFGSSRILFALALLGATLMPREGLLALLTGLLLLVSYLIYAHFPVWSLYYLETHTVLSAAAGIGLSAAIGLLPGNLNRVAAALLIVALTTFGALEIADARSQKERSGPRSRRLRAALASLPKTEKTVVFIRCAPGADPHEGLVQNGPDLENARIWLVHDFGEHNRDLRTVSPDRTAYLYDETRGALTHLRPQFAGFR